MKRNIEEKRRIAKSNCVRERQHAHSKYLTQENHNQVLVRLALATAARDNEALMEQNTAKIRKLYLFRCDQILPKF